MTNYKTVQYMSMKTLEKMSSETLGYKLNTYNNMMLHCEHKHLEDGKTEIIITDNTGLVYDTIINY